MEIQYDVGMCFWMFTFGLAQLLGRIYHEKRYLTIFIIALIFTGCQKTLSQDTNVNSTKICTDYPAGFDPHNNNLWQAAILKADVAKK